MALIEHVLAPNSAGTPTCICGKGMRLMKIVPHPIAVDTETVTSIVIADI